MSVETKEFDVMDKKDRKTALKKEAEKRGISYDEMKKMYKEATGSSKRKKTTEADKLESDQHKNDIKRLRSYSKDLGEDKSEDRDSKRRRTRSMDEREEKKAKVEASKNMTPEEWRKEETITLKGHGANSSATNFAAPYIQFSDAPFSDRIQKTLTAAGFTQPSSIQAQAWPLANEGKDLICIAKTGSGKTCGFLLPVFHDYEQNKSGRSGGYTKPILLVLAPTRELCVQISDESRKFGNPLGVRSVCCYGGSPKYAQIQAMQRGVECIIACPGRLNDLIQMRKCDLSGIKYLVLDEADRMLDMGFEPQIRSIVEQTSAATRQTLLFSATWPKEIQRLAFDFLKDPIQINVGEVNALVANKDIKQTIHMITQDEKMGKLQSILKELQAADADGKDEKPGVANGAKAHAKVIVFVARKHSCNDLANKLWEDGFAVDCLHGDRPQWERSKVMTAFKSGALRMLIATDVAARGLDVKDVGVVVNYDMPAGVNGVEDYVHRIGRTGRAGAKGNAETFFTRADSKSARGLVEVLTKAEQEIPADLAALGRPRFGGRGGGYGGRGGGRGGYRGGGGGGGRGRGYMSGGGGRGGGGGYGGRFGGGGGGRGGFRR